VTGAEAGAARSGATRAESPRAESPRAESPRADTTSRAESTRGASLAASAARSAAVPAGNRPARDRRAAPDPATAAIPGLRPDRAPAVPHPSAPLPDIPLSALRGDRDTGRTGLRENGRTGVRDTGRPDVRDTGRTGIRDTGRTGVRAARPGQRPAPRDEHTSTGPIPVVRGTDVDDLDADSTPQESALAWLRFAGELVIALAAGVGVFFAATLLWEMAPYVALLLVPLAVAGLVAGVGMWRQRQGAEPAGPRLLALLVLAGTLLTIVPAAQLLAAR
jgi:hypothetical protein